MRPAALGLVSLCLAATQPIALGVPTPSAAPTSFVMPLGDDSVTVLSDGAVTRPLSQVLPRSTGAAMVALPINVFLIRTATRLILIDTGAGALLGPGGAGQLQTSLRAAGYRPEQIDAILLTHAHPDHIGGLSAGGTPVFPNATLYADRREIITDAAAPAGVRDPDRLAALKRFQTLMIEPYRRAGKLRLFNGAGEVLPGIHAMPSYGHSPGHTAYLVESRRRRLLLWGDVIHVADVQFADPSITTASDFDPALAVASRRLLLAQVTRDTLLVGAAHIAFPGLGHVRKAGGGYRWVPLGRR